jgi:hypothetical protein
MRGAGDPSWMLTVAQKSRDNRDEATITVREQRPPSLKSAID